MEFGNDMAIPFSSIRDGRSDAILALADLAGVDAAELQEWTPEVAGRDHLFRGEVFHARALKDPTVRGCPVCLREDVASCPDLPPHQAMALRGHWMPRPVTLCIVHRHRLVPLWTEKDAIHRYDVAHHFAVISGAVIHGELDESPRDPSAFDLWIERRLAEGRGQGWFESLALYPAAHFCELLGRSILTLRMPKSRKLRPEHQWMSFDIGFYYTEKGPTAIRSALTDLQQLIGAPQDGPKRKFGDLYDRLAHDLTGADYQPFRQLLRDHIAETWPLGPGDDLIGEPVLERRVHSVLTAARETGVDPRRLRKLLAEAGWVRPAGEGRPDAWELFDAAAADPFLRSLSTGVSAGEVQEKAGISRSQFQLLRQDGYLAPAFEGPDHKPLWDLRAVLAFIDGLLTGAQPMSIVQHGWEDVAKAAQRLKIQPGEILRMIETRRLSRVGRHVDRQGYAAILVQMDEVERLLDRPAARGVSVELFAKTVGIRPTAAMRLARAGHVPSTPGINPKTKAAQRFLSPADIAAYDARFVTLRRLAAILGQSWQSLTFRLDEAGVTPFSPEGADLGAIYEWTAVERSFCCRWPTAQDGQKAAGSPAA